MTNSTLETGSSLDIDELFADTDAEPADESEPRADPRNAPEQDETEDIEDVTAGELFQQLSTDHAPTVESPDGYAELSDESPEEIIASADEAVEPMDEVDEAIAADDDLLDDLLLSGRTKADGFLWVETDADEDIDESDDDTDQVDAEQVTEDEAESELEPESAPEPESEPEPTADVDEAVSAPTLDDGPSLDATFEDGNAPDVAADPVDDDGETDDATADEAGAAGADEAGATGDDEDDDDDSGGLASKIRSILSS
ncbi:hypothetical protein [Haloarchaeobius sp. HME9146]|uniref:hypothetical protein n=1 Tax=Haloarchaeobius sp. HME9146 TaxID=2978732 RepID=UPI0021BF04C5|nr:hypothetical protein [Haloarchaeobius sp. HME9146]MCT9096551.1 hypothetical protein [Haloarchaeobius sp. HME9146]